MVMKCMDSNRGNILVLYIIKIKGENEMLKMLGKLAEKYAKSSNTACFLVGILHQPKMPANMIKKD